MTNIGIDVASLLCLILTQIYIVVHTADIIYERRCTKWGALWALTCICCNAFALGINIYRLF
jgi:hypothetical protein